MSFKERKRLDALSRVARKEISLVSAAELMGLSVRQARRVWRRWRAEGDAGLLHGLRGRSGNRRLPLEVRDQIVGLCRSRYHDFGPTLTCEKLAESGLSISPNTLTGLLKAHDLWTPRRKSRKHRRRRQRRANFGTMLQQDGSHHAWFEDRGGKCVLMVLVDDATGQTYARFYDAETTDAAFDVFGRWVKAHGVPRELYVDRHSIYRDEDHPEKPTQFGRALAELDVRLIQARSPQAKGRVERRNRDLQDRLVKEMRLRNISDMARGNLFLEGMFLPQFNRRFAVAAAESGDFHRVLGPGMVLEEILCLAEGRNVGNDWCVRWNNRWLQIDKRHRALSLAGKQVTVKQRADGGLVVVYEGKRLTFVELASAPKPAKQKGVIVNNRRYVPAANHPWRGGPPLPPPPSLGPATAAP